MFRESRFDLDTIAFLVVVGLLAIGAAWVLLRNDGVVPSTSPGAVTVTSPPASPRPDDSTRPAVKGELRITAPASDTWVQVRRTGAKGAVLFSGTVMKGKTRVFVGDVLWLRLRVPADVRLRIEGHRIAPLKAERPVDYRITNGKLERQG